MCKLIYDLPTYYSEVAEKLYREEKQSQEQRDLEIALKIERELNFRASSTYDLERNNNEASNPDHLYQDDIGEEGQPAQVPPRQDLGYFNIHNGRINGSNEFDDDNRYVQQEPPKWLIHPINLMPDKHIKVFDFKQGSTNNELRNTAASNSDFEYETMENPVLSYHNINDLESKLAKKQQKYLKRFEKDEDRRTEEAKRNGSIIEERKQSDPEFENNGVNEPLLAGQNMQLIARNNANVQVQNRTVIPGLLVRNANGTYRVC
jgi:hypothetical protein